MNDAPRCLLPDGPLCAIDLGSNSFHMQVAELVDGRLRTVERRKEKVQLASGLVAGGPLDDAALARGLATLGRFADRIEGIPRDRIRMVGTSALRLAGDAHRLTDPARNLLGVPVQIISGSEEARLINFGVTRALGGERRRLVVDIGGGSTEIVIGDGFEAREVVSIDMGCVVFKERFFAGPHIGEGFVAAEAEARRLLAPHGEVFRHAGWCEAAGASGTVESCEQAIIANGWSNADISVFALQRLRDRLTTSRSLLLSGVSSDRQDIFPAGAAILSALFRTFAIERMVYARASLQDGLLQTLIGLAPDGRVWDRTRARLQRDLHVDTGRSERVAGLARRLLAAVDATWIGDPERAEQLLCWAADLLEIGRAVGEQQYQKHSAYLLEHAALPGLARTDRYALVTLVRGHRGGVPRMALAAFDGVEARLVERGGVLLRLAALLCARRGATPPPPVAGFSAQERRLELTFAPGWLEAHPAVRQDLEAERLALAENDFDLQLR